MKTGGLFGNQEDFSGVGIIIDTYDNDRTGLHPYLSIVFNDGQGKYEHSHKEGGLEKGGCSILARNLDKPSTIRITYVHGILEVMVDVESKGSPKACASDVSIELPPGYYFGFSSATGHLADNHDVHSFVLRDMDFNQKTVIRDDKKENTPRNVVVDNAAAQQIYQKQEALNRLLMSRFDELKNDLSQISQGISKGGGDSKKMDKNDCTTLSTDLKVVTKSVERFDREFIRKTQELTKHISLMAREEPPTSTLSIITFILVAVIFLMNIIILIGSKDKRRNLL
jgi:hypothetical protein